MKEGEKVLWVQSRDFPAACGADHGEGAVLLQPMKVNSGAENHLQAMEEFMPEQVDAKKEAVRSPHWSRLLAVHVDLGREEPTPGQFCW